ncbi:zinc finger protein 709-like [Ostrinia furnacalis]|uniref:zinc finger protein 709-like n=1 Tax=Ostrinia furnacalis TaxID=93504 RepID=UPI00103B217A|nr:zinc finger protein 709-like [Ostrinia furnacalis]
MEDQICRICLGDGDIPIYDEKDDSRISEEIRIFGDICLDKYDDTPKHICETCYQLLQSAVVFRTLAKETQSYMEEPVSDEDNFQESDSDNNALDRIDQSELLQNSEDNEMVMIIVSDTDKNSIISTENANSDEETEGYNCDLCNMNFESTQDYNQHINSNCLGPMNIQCPKCNLFVLTENFNKHLKTHNSEEVSLLMQECTTCEILFQSIEDFEVHCKTEEHENALKKPSDNPKIKCPVCEKYLTKSYYKLHLKLHGNDEEKGERLRKCPFCEKSVCYSYYRAHIQKIHPDQQTNDEYQPRRKHNRTHKDNDSIQKLICDQCGKDFKRKYALKLHMLTHGNEYKYKCMFCPYRGRYAGLLKIHIRTHTGDYNYKCTKCPAKFITKSNLNKHLQRHQGPTDIKCETCDKYFYSKSDFDKHNDAIHLGIRNFACNMCGKAFTSRNSMMCHQLKVHKRKRLTNGKGRVADYLKDNPEIAKDT